MHIRNPRPSDFCSPIGLELFSDVQSTSVQNTNRPVDTRGAARLFPNVKEEDKTFFFFFSVSHCRTTFPSRARSSWWLPTRRRGARVVVRALTVLCCMSRRVCSVSHQVFSITPNTLTPSPIGGPGGGEFTFLGCYPDVLDTRYCHWELSDARGCSLVAQRCVGLFSTRLGG